MWGLLRSFKRGGDEGLEKGDCCGDRENGQRCCEGSLIRTLVLVGCGGKERREKSKLAPRF